MRKVRDFFSSIAILIVVIGMIFLYSYAETEVLKKEINLEEYKNVETIHSFSKKFVELTSISLDKQFKETEEVEKFLEQSQLDISRLNKEAGRRFYSFIGNNSSNEYRQVISYSYLLGFYDEKLVGKRENNETVYYRKLIKKENISLRKDSLFRLQGLISEIVFSYEDLYDFILEISNDNMITIGEYKNFTNKYITVQYKTTKNNELIEELLISNSKQTIIDKLN